MSDILLGMRVPPLVWEQGVERAIDLAREAGLEVIDVPYANAEIRAACDRAGLRIGTVDAAFVPQLLSRDEAKRESARESILKQMGEMRSFNAALLFMCLCPEDHRALRKDTFDIWKSVFPEIVARAEREDICIVIEGWPGPAPWFPTIGCTPEMWRAMFEAVPSRHFGLTYDPSHLVRLGIDCMRVLEEFGDRVLHCHAKDTEMSPERLYAYGNLPPSLEPVPRFAQGHWRYAIPGRGRVRWDSVAERLERIGYRGALSVEMEDADFWGEADKEREGVRRSAAYLSQVFRREGG